MIEGITFDDVLIVPKMSDIESRSDISLRQEFLGLQMDLPIISANMDYVTGSDMAIAMRQNGALGILHRFYKDNGLFTWDIADLVEEKTPIIISLGTRSIEESMRALETLNYKTPLYDGDVDVEGIMPYAVCIDVAHGEHTKVIELIKLIKSKYNDLYIIAGNVATYQGFNRLAQAGADAIKVGIGPGSVCTTREVTGVGVPQLSALMDIDARRSVQYQHVKVIADGGIKNSGDIVKALAAGADVVMLGNLLAGADECPGEVRVAPDNSRWRPYRGQSIFGTNGMKFVPEGIEGWVKEKGPVSEILRKLAGGIRSGMSYVGARNLQELRENVEFIKISQATHIESNTRVSTNYEEGQ